MGNLNRKQNKQSDRQRAINTYMTQTWDRIYSIIRPSTENQPKLRELAALPADKRASFVNQYWGESALRKVEAMLGRIDCLEKELNSIQ